jgi:hypothetical protein
MFTSAAHLAAIASIIAALSACGGDSETESGDSENTRGTLADGHVGDNPFYDNGKSGGFADGARVDGAGSGSGESVHIRWDGVSKRVDGHAENELAGYRVYFGHQAGSYDYVVEVADPYAKSYTLPDLPPGTYYFVATAVDGLDHESTPSKVSTIMVN